MQLAVFLLPPLAALVFLFALFHDSMRINDSFDPLHGPRAAVLARELHGGTFDLGDAEMDLLKEAEYRVLTGRRSITKNAPPPAITNRGVSGDS